MTTLAALARGFAHAAHLGQYDRDSRLHIEHVERVVRGTWEVLAGASARGHDIAGAAAWLHDVVEDTSCTFEYLARVGFPSDVVAVVRLLTRPDDEVGVPGAYLDYVARIAEAPGDVGRIARAVKVADLNDNIARSVAEGNDRLAARYRRALGIVLGGVDGAASAGMVDA